VLIATGELLVDELLKDGPRFVERDGQRRLRAVLEGPATATEPKVDDVLVRRDFDELDFVDLVRRPLAER
jgi:hypothetical protein